MMIESPKDLAAVVSPDAAYFLGMMHLTEVEKKFWSSGNSSKSEGEWHGAEDAITASARSGIAPFPVPRRCYYAFVPDNTPLGVVPDMMLPADEFTADGVKIEELGNGQKIIGFGLFTKGKRQVVKLNNFNFNKGSDENFFELGTSKEIKVEDALIAIGSLKTGGNLMPGKDNKGYFDLILEGNYQQLERDTLQDIANKQNGLSINEKQFADVYNMADAISRDSRKLYDQDYDQSVNVLAGNGRTLLEAQNIWNQFRAGFHTYGNVQEAFQRVFGLDPNSEVPLDGLFSTVNGEPNSNSPSAADFRRIDSATNKDEQEAALAALSDKNNVFKKYSGSGSPTAEDEYAAIFGDNFFKTPSFLDQENAIVNNQYAGYGERVREGVEASRKTFIDDQGEDGLINYFNTLLNEKISGVLSSLFESLKLSGYPPTEAAKYVNSIKTPKQLFLFVVGSFRNAMWSDPYARAWLVLKPNKKLKLDRDDWDFGPVVKIFQAYIDPTADYAKPPYTKFKKLLAQNRSEGSNSSSFIGKRLEDIDGFWDKNIGPLFTAIGDGLSGLVNLFRMSMMQLGYGLDQVGQMSKQANILNKVLNDSIYYSLGRDGSLLRAVDNPFTREYGEPVIEIRQPFQRMHYLSSFSHILSNGITENINGVATQVTAVSDGKYPVTVALDKSAPPERQVEKTVETGLYFDNVVGSGLFGALQPILHPFEFARGISKIAQGTPDELLAKRVALAHLRESLKDIYTGEIVIIGNPDIRPHDLVYLADVYERMYGIFEVEQVVHHFTSELGFITSITPNALVTVNDPARWFMSSWIGSWMHMQSLRNDTRLYMSSISSGVTSMGQVSVDGLSDALKNQMVGGIQFTHGASALTKDIMAHFASEGINDINSQVKGLVAGQSGFSSEGASIGGLGAMFAGATGLGAALAGVAAIAIPGAGALVGGAIVGLGAGIGGRTAWKGWSWIRDNVLDQHGCYIQYLNRNGRAMDAGLNQSGQGMVVGRYHTKKLLPGILGVSTKVRTEEGYSYIRTDDLMKNLGWKEKEINDLVRYIDFENALVNSQILKYSGIGPEKAGLNQFFKVICKVERVIDGDTIDVFDILDTEKNLFRVRFDGINTPEINVITSDMSVSGKTAKIISVKVEDVPGETYNKITYTTQQPHNFEPDTSAVIAIDPSSNISDVLINTSFKIESVTENTFSAITSRPILVETNITGSAAVFGGPSGEFINVNSPGGKALTYVKNALKDKIIILRISPDKDMITASFGDSNFEPGGQYNSPDFYQTDVFGNKNGKYEYNIKERIMAIAFHRAPDNVIEKIALDANAIYSNAINTELPRGNIRNEKLKRNFAEGVFFDRFDQIFKACGDYDKNDYFSQYSSNAPWVSSMTNAFKKDYNSFVAMKILEYIYNKVSEWPNVEWDEYYEDGTPVSLNYELITKGLAKVYTKGLLIEQPSVITSGEMAALPQQIQVERTK